MTKWKNKQIKGISWNTRQDESTAQKRASNTDTHGFFAESSKVAKTINETQEQTSQVLSIPS